MCYTDKKRVEVLNDYKTLRNVSVLCSKHGIARGTFYNWLHDSQTERPAPRSKHQHTPAHLMIIDSVLRQRWSRG
jgi:hypothetical protein